MTDHLLLVDGSSYVYRAFHALPKLTRKSDGLEVGALVGFCGMLWRLVEGTGRAHAPVTHIAVIFDKGRVNFRHRLYPQYKGQRGVTPEGLTPQFALIRRAVGEFNIAMIEKEDFEADDLIATYADTFDGEHVTIVSPDKDLLQLVDDANGVMVLDPINDRVLTELDVVERWGVAPRQMVDLQALAGDTADNVPGVPAIGAKTAAELLRDYGDLETLLACAGAVKQPTRRANLIRYADQARLSKRLVTLDRAVSDLPPIPALAVQPRDWDKILSFCDEMEFIAFKAKVVAARPTEGVS